MSASLNYNTLPTETAKAPQRGRKLVIAAAAAASFCLGAGVAYAAPAAFQDFPRQHEPRSGNRVPVHRVHVHLIRRWPQDS